MNARLSVGIESNCTAPLRLERVSMRLFKLMGVDSLLLPDHYLSFVPRSVWNPESTPAARLVPSPDAFFDPFVMMGMMAARYPRVRIGTGVTESFRRHPATLAQAFVTLDHLTGGRAILGIGNGERENTAPYGIPFTKRVARLEEALTIIRRLWESRGEPVDFDGSFWRLRRALFTTPLHDRKPPALWVAAHAPRMLGLAGRFADGWYPTIKMSPADYRERLERIHTTAAAAGRSLASFEPATQIQIVIGASRKRALDQMPQIEAAQRRATPELLADALFAGSVDEIVTEVRALVGAGLRHVVIWNIGPIVSGATAGDLVRLALLVRRLKRITIPVVRPAAPTTVEQPFRAPAYGTGAARAG